MSRCQVCGCRFDPECACMRKARDDEEREAERNDLESKLDLLVAAARAAVEAWETTGPRDVPSTIHLLEHAMPKLKAALKDVAT